MPRRPDAPSPCDPSPYDPRSIDDHTAGRLLSGSMPAADAPPGYQGVAHLVEALQAPPSRRELRDRDGVVAMLAAAVEPAPPRSRAPRVSRLVGVLAATATLALTGSLAAAGALPGGAQDVAHRAFDAIGISVPGSDDHAGDRPGAGVDGQGTDPGGPSGNPSAQESSGQDGQRISDLARDEDGSGIEKGATVSGEASSDGQSQAGENGATAGTPQGNAFAGERPSVTTTAPPSAGPKKTP